MEKYWTTREVAERLRVSDICVRRWISLGKLKKTKAGGATRITETDLQEFIRNSNKKAA